MNVAQNGAASSTRDKAISNDISTVKVKTFTQYDPYLEWLFFLSLDVSYVVTNRVEWIVRIIEFFWSMASNHRAGVHAFEFRHAEVFGMHSPFQVKRCST